MNITLKNNEEKYNIDDFCRIIKKLRAPDGCIWDREQTHKSIRRDFLEECYEAVEAIDLENSAMLREELGDVLLQVVFHSVIEEENGNFTFSDVINDVANKMVIRHPHVFGEIKVENIDELLTNWDNIKKSEKGQKSDKEQIASISKAMPALMRSQKVQKKFIKLDKEVKSEYKDDLSELLKGKINEESIGSLLSSVVALARENGIDAEESLAKYIDNCIENNFDE